MNNSGDKIMTTGMKTGSITCDVAFKKNGEYDFRLEGVGEWNGERYLLLSYGEERAVTLRGMEKTDFVFRTRMLDFQHEFSSKELQGTIRCRVKGFVEDDDGRESKMPILYQCTGPILAKYYEVGKEYAFKVCDCPGSVIANGKVTKWYTLVDFMNFKHRYWSIETLHPGDVVRATVDRFENERIRFRDHDERPLTAYYKEGAEYDFAVVGDELSKKEGFRYLVLRSPRPADSHVEHRYLYPAACPTGKKAGDMIRLRCTGFSTYGWLHLEYEGDARIDEELKSLSEAERSDLMDDSVPTEYASSFAFSHGNSAPDVDNRLGSEIMMRIAALANSEGGRILVGVTPERTYRGIAQDLPYLNASSEDGGAYPRTLDGLKQKILDTVAAKLGDRAVSLVSVEYRKVEHERVICDIGVSKSMWPVYFSQKSLYVKNGEERQRLLGDDITRFVLSRLATFAGRGVGQSV